MSWLSDGSARAENYALKLRQIATSARLESGIHASTVLPSLPKKVSKPNQTAVQSGLYKALQVLTENSANALRTDVDTIYGWTVGPCSPPIPPFASVFGILY